MWNRIAPELQDQIVEMVLEQTELSPRELAVRFTDEKRYFVSEATVYRLLKAHDLITSPAYTVIKAAEAFHTRTTRPNEMWQTDFTYFKIIGWGWVYLSTVLDDYSRYIIAWQLCTTMCAEDVTDTLDMALVASGCDHANVLHRPRLLSDNGPSYIAGELAEYIEANQMSHVRGAPPVTAWAVDWSSFDLRPVGLRLLTSRRNFEFCSDWKPHSSAFPSDGVPHPKPQTDVLRQDSQCCLIRNRTHRETIARST